MIIIIKNLYQRHRPAPLVLALALIILVLSGINGCRETGDGGSHGYAGSGPGPDAGTGPGAGAATDADAATDTDAALRPSDPVVYVPDAPGTKVIGTDTLTVDISNTDQGYIMVRYSGSADRVNIQITGSDDVHYKYFLGPSSDFTALPLTDGSGVYAIDGYEHIADSKYSVLFHETVDVRLENELLPFLYPSQYVNFTADSLAVSAAQEVVSGAVSDLDAVADIYHYIITHISYDEEKAATVASGYLPDVDETLTTGRGICFDYAALTCAMLRSQNIPAKLEIGYAGEIYHAWISVYTDETGWIDRLIEFSQGGWTRMDPTFASGKDNDSEILDYINDNSNYQTLYSR